MKKPVNGGREGIKKGVGGQIGGDRAGVMKEGAGRGSRVEEGEERGVRY